jgi:RNA ligase (TIGR02306 family)
MASFEVKAYQLQTIEEHPNADALELAVIGGYRSCVPIGQYKPGDVALYIPEAALIPEPLLRELGLAPEPGELREGKPIGPLASKGNRVKAIRLRGIVSQGIVCRPKGLQLELGVDYAEQLGITKYEPPVPIDMAGQVYPADGLTSYTDIENVKRYPDVLVEGEQVVLSEKIHGSCAVIHFDGEQLHASSKGFAAQGLAIEDTKDESGRSRNLYWRGTKAEGLDEKLPMIANELGAKSITLYGEVGPCQDLRYGAEKDGSAIWLRAFDLKADGEYVDYTRFVEIMAEHDIDTAPVLYVGPYSDAVLAQHTDGSTVFGNGVHIREGVIVKPVTERYDLEAGRVILKSISDAYLLRKGGTEYN